MSVEIGLLWLVSYLFGAIPFAYIVAKLHGVNLHAVGSGNIGATNVGRALGRKWGILVFVLDFLKGAVPVVAILPLARLINPEATDPFDIVDLTCVGAGTFALLGHIYPIYLKFKGGKGVATGAGVGIMLMPIPGVAAVFIWLLFLAIWRYVSLASIAAAVTFIVLRLSLTPDPFGPSAWLISTFCSLAASFIIIKHRSNVARLWRGTESKIGQKSSPSSTNSQTS